MNVLTTDIGPWFSHSAHIFTMRCICISVSRECQRNLVTYVINTFFSISTRTATRHVGPLLNVFCSYRPRGVHKGEGGGGWGGQSGPDSPLELQIMKLSSNFPEPPYIFLNFAGTLQN